MRSFCLCLWWPISDLSQRTVPTSSGSGLKRPLDHDLDYGTSRCPTSKERCFSSSCAQSPRSSQQCNPKLKCGTLILWVMPALLSHIKVSETGRGRPSVLQLTCQACLQHVSSLNDFSFSTKPTVNCPEMCLSSHEILLSSHSFPSMKCGSRNQNLLSSFVAWRGVFFSLARCVCQDWPAW